MENGRNLAIKQSLISILYISSKFKTKMKKFLKRQEKLNRKVVLVMINVSNTLLKKSWVEKSVLLVLLLLAILLDSIQSGKSMKWMISSNLTECIFTNDNQQILHMDKFIKLLMHDRLIEWQLVFYFYSQII